MDFFVYTGWEDCFWAPAELTETNGVSYRLPNKVPRNHQLSHNSLSAAGEVERHRCWISVRLTLVLSSGHLDGCSLQYHLFLCKPHRIGVSSYLSQCLLLLTHSWLYAVWDDANSWGRDFCNETEEWSWVKKKSLGVLAADFEATPATSLSNATWLTMVRLSIDPRWLRLISTWLAR